MRKNQKQKTMAIVALCISVLGLTLGFAAFSNTLTISSSATVSPDSSDFKMVIYGVEDMAKYKPLDFNTITSPTISRPQLYNNATATDAIIDNDTLTIKNMNVNFVKPNDRVMYIYKIVNEGKYTGYITKETLKKLAEHERLNKVCTPEPGTSPEMVEKTCQNIIPMITITNNYDGFYFAPSVQGEHEWPEYVEIPVGEKMELTYEIWHGGGYVDGNVDISIPDLKMEFTTVKPEV